MHDIVFMLNECAQSRRNVDRNIARWIHVPFVAGPTSFFSSPMDSSGTHSLSGTSCSTEDGALQKSATVSVPSCPWKLFRILMWT